MEVEEQKHGDCKVWGLLKLPFRGSSNTRRWNDGVIGYPNHRNNQQHHLHDHYYWGGGHDQHPHGASPLPTAGSVSAAAKSLLPTRRRLKLDPPARLYFPYEPGKQRCNHKFQTTAPKSCFMRPPGAILAPGESIIATVFKFVEHPENNEKPMNQKSKVKFRIMCFKVNGQMEYVPDLFDEQRDQVVVEQILRVVFLDPERPNPICV